MRVLVLGATGFLGLNIVDALVQAEMPVLAAHRRHSLSLRRRHVPMVHIDILDGDALRAAMAQSDVVVHAAGYYPRHSQDPAQALRVGLMQCAAVLDAAADAGVQRVIYLSTTASVAPRVDAPSTERDIFTSSPDHGVYHSIKWQMEQMFVRESRVPVVTLCPGACIGPWDLRVGTSALLVATARGQRPAHPDGWVNIVDARDVATAVATACSKASVPRRILLSGSNHRLHDLLVNVSARYGVAAPSTPLAARLAAARADLEERRALADGDRALIVREIVDLIVHGVPIDASLAEQSLGVRWTPLSETLDAFDAFARRMRLIPSAPAGPHAKEHSHA